MLAFKIIVGILGAIAIFTGANDFWNGASVTGDFGNLGANAKDPQLNYTIRFLGAIWMGFGVLLILFVLNLARYETPLIIAFIIVIIGGIGRVISVVQFGIAEGNHIIVYTTLGVELVLVPALLVWFLLMDKTAL
jgi:hypothetical protein